MNGKGTRADERNSKARTHNPLQTEIKMREFGAARARRCDFAVAFFVVSFAGAFKIQ